MKHTLLALLFVSSAVASAGAQYVRIHTCSGAPFLEGEYNVYLATDKSSAKINYSGVKEYPVTNMHLGPVSNFDFQDELGTQRIIVAVDGGHEFHMLKNGKFVKVADLICNRAQ